MKDVGLVSFWYIDANTGAGYEYFAVDRGLAASSWFNVNRISQASSGNHDVAYPGYSPGGYNEGTVFKARSDSGSGLHALYNCRGGTDTFVSVTSWCEGATVLGRIGFVYDGAGTNRTPVYRCSLPSDHFVSVSSNCEGSGATNEGVLGYSGP